MNILIKKIKDKLNFIVKYLNPPFSSMSKSDYYKAIPKSLYFNLKYFSIREAIRLPILISHHVKLKRLKGKIILENARFGGVKIGFGELSGFNKEDSKAVIDITGRIIFRGSAFIGNGNRFQIKGTLILGKNVSIVADNIIRAINKICIGDNCVIGFTNLFMDSDFHKIYNLEDNKTINENEKIVIGTHVWITSRCTILKKTKIGNDCIVGSNTLLNNEIIRNNVIIAGNPGKVCKDRISWEK